MGSQNGIRVGMGSKECEELMGVEVGSLGPVGWLVIQEEASGTPRGNIAAALNVGAEDIAAMIHVVCKGETEEESESTWMKGIVALKTAAMLTQTMLRNGWDAVEAMALQKLSNQLSEMKGNGDAEQMLRIASTANKSIRRGAGESGTRSGGAIGAGAEVEFGVSLQSGVLGRIQLRLSDRVREQMADPARVIDSTARSVGPARHEMLGLNETRGLLVGNEEEAKEESRLPDDKTGFHFDLSKGPAVTFEGLIQGENTDDE